MKIKKQKFIFMSTNHTNLVYVKLHKLFWNYIHTNKYSIGQGIHKVLFKNAISIIKAAAQKGNEIYYMTFYFILISNTTKLCKNLNTKKMATPFSIIIQGAAKF